MRIRKAVISVGLTVGLVAGTLLPIVQQASPAAASTVYTIYNFPMATWVHEGDELCSFWIRINNYRDPSTGEVTALTLVKFSNYWEAYCSEFPSNNVSPNQVDTFSQVPHFQQNFWDLDHCNTATVFINPPAGCTGNFVDSDTVNIQSDNPVTAEGYDSYIIQGQVILWDTPSHYVEYLVSPLPS
jgi:hypothetical protein